MRNTAMEGVPTSHAATAKAFFRPFAKGLASTVSLETDKLLLVVIVA